MHRGQCRSLKPLINENGFRGSLWRSTDYNTMDHSTIPLRSVSKEKNSHRSGSDDESGGRKPKLSRSDSNATEPIVVSEGLKDRHRNKYKLLRFEDDDDDAFPSTF